MEHTEKLKKHGGNVKLLARDLGVDIDTVIDFSSNINPYGPPQSVVEAVQRAITTINEYPEQEAETFVSAIAGSLGVSADTIIAGNGTIELIYLLPQALKTRKALLPVPSFTEYELALLRAGAKIEYENAFSARDVAAMISGPLDDIDTVILGNPNNPCGYLLDRDTLLEAVRNNPGCTWVMDEAFIDFAPEGTANSLIKEAVNRNNLIVLRSLTKAYSIAGLRLGYMVASPALAKKIRDIKYPWSVNSMAINAGMAAIKDEEFIIESVPLLQSEAKRLYKELAGVDGLSPFEPSANYILVRIEADISSSQLQRKLLRHGLAIRDCSTYTGMNDRYFRVAVKRPEDNDKLLVALREVMGNDG